jgi:subtilisin family serine protease
MPILATLFFMMLTLPLANASTFKGYIVKLKSGIPKNHELVLSSFGTISKVVDTSFGHFVRLESHHTLNDMDLKNLNQLSGVEYAEPNFLLSLYLQNKNKIKNQFVGEEAPAPKDNFFNKQWGLKNSTLEGADLNILKAWGLTKGSSVVKIAVIDTGVDYTHPELREQMDINEQELNGVLGVDDDGNGYIDDIYGYNFANKNGDPQDGNGHGTHSAGVIGAAHNGVGVAGVMAQVKIVAIKFLSDSGTGETIDAIAAINYAIKRGVKIMSNSWGGTGKDQSLEEAIKAADKAGIVFVTAAGGEASNNDIVASYPANYDTANNISVASYTASGVKSSFSNFGLKSVHVTAPGTAIFSTYKNGGYLSLSGTSIAAPFIAGVVGLLLAKEPFLTPAQIKERLIRTSQLRPKLTNVSLSKGSVDAYRALMNK